MGFECTFLLNNSPNIEAEFELLAISLERFGCIYATYRTKIYCLCLRMTGNRAEAEDLTQEAFLRLFRKFDTFRNESSFYSWLRRIAINVVLLRFEKPGWHRETSLDALAEPRTTEDSSPRMQFGCVDCELQAVLDRVDLERALDRLSPGFRTVLILHDVEGYCHGEISQLMGCSIGTSKSQLHKARSRMRGFLGGYDGRGLPA